jgi:phosphoribosylformylglycinamidine cyclo-ligase
MEQAFNLGVGMVAVVDAMDADRAISLLRTRGTAAWRIGDVRPGRGSVTMSGDYAGSTS